jgi:glutamate racemase
MNNNPIGIIDSGVGGLSIASNLIVSLPSESFIYLGDSLNCPYGQKRREEIIDLTKKMINFLITKEIKLLVVACNTITVTCIEDLRKIYPKLPIVGIVPVIKTAAKVSKNKKIGIFSTKVTAESKYQLDLIEKYHNGCEAINIGSGDLVKAIEALDFEYVDRVLASELAIFKEKQIDTLALGCSHFPLIKAKIEADLPGVTVLDSGEAVSHQVKRILEHNQLISKNNNPSYNFYTTGNLESVTYFVNKLTNKAKISRITLQ